MITIGSLFDGISGFPLAGDRLGMKAVWGSEIEPFPIKVSAIRYPKMEQVGDITKINIEELEPVEIITGGSPCQDLSIAGKRAGLAGARSGLFMEQIRIVKELRDKDVKRDRTDGLIRPRFMVWENVPGAFSSNKGEDFRAVLEETARIADETVTIPQPPKGKWSTVGTIMGNGWSIAWRILDAQYWGVPQRRRRIFLVADFGGQSAPEILFKREGLSRHIAESRKEGEGITTDVKGGVDATKCYDIGEARLRTPQEYNELSPTITQRCGTGGNNVPAVVTPKTMLIRCGCSGGGKGALIQDNKSATLGCNNIQTLFAPIAYGICSYESNSMKSSNPHSGIYEANTSRTLDLNGGSPACNQGGIAIVQKTYGADLSQKAEGICFKEEIATCVNTGTHGGHGNNVITYQKVTGPLMANSHPGSYTGQDAYSDMLVTPYAHSSFADYKEGFGQLRASGGDLGGGSETLVKSGYTVRRLTPLECERLQDYPDGWTDIPGASDSVRYKALGNSVAVCCPEYVLEGIKEVLERDS